MLLSLTGIAVWWPGPGLWRKRLGIQRGTSWKRTMWDLHNAAGFWVCAGLAFFAATGMMFAWPEAAKKLAGVREWKKQEWRLTHSSGRQPASVAELAAAAERAIPGGRDPSRRAIDAQEPGQRPRPLERGREAGALLDLQADGHALRGPDVPRNPVRGPMEEGGLPLENIRGPDDREPAFDPTFREDQPVRLGQLARSKPQDLGRVGGVNGEHVMVGREEERQA